MKRMHSKGEIEDIINDSELAEQVNELAAVYTYEDLTLTEAQYSELTSTGSVQIDLSEDPDSLARLHNANVVTIYTNPEHTGKVIIAQRQTLTASKATFTAFENDNSAIKQYAMDVNLIVEDEGGAVNIGLAEVGGGTKLYRHALNMRNSEDTQRLVLNVITTSNAPFSVQGGPPRPSIETGEIINIYSNLGATIAYFSNQSIYTIHLMNDQQAITTTSLIDWTIISDEITEI